MINSFITVQTWFWLGFGVVSILLWYVLQFSKNRKTLLCSLLFLIFAAIAVCVLDYKNPNHQPLSLRIVILIPLAGFLFWEVNRLLHLKKGAQNV